MARREEPSWAVLLAESSVATVWDWQVRGEDGI